MSVDHSKARVVVTGATGFVGRALCRELVARGRKVISVVRRPGTSVEGSTEVLLHEGGWIGILEADDLIYHLIGVAHRPTARVDEFHEVNVGITKELCEAADQAGARRLIYVSSVKVYGNSRPIPISEETPVEPEDVYGRTKLEAERTIREMKRVPWTIVRIPLVYGVAVGGNIDRLIRAIKSGVPLPFGRIENRRSLVSLENLVDALATCEDRRAARRVFLVADQEVVSTPQICRHLGEGVGTRARLIGMPVSLLRTLLRTIGRTELIARLIDSLEMNSKEFRETLGWEPVVETPEGLRRAGESFASRS